MCTSILTQTPHEVQEESYSYTHPRPQDVCSLKVLQPTCRRIIKEDYMIAVVKLTYNLTLKMQVTVHNNTQTRNYTWTNWKKRSDAVLILSATVSGGHCNRVLVGSVADSQFSRISRESVHSEVQYIQY